MGEIHYTDTGQMIVTHDAEDCRGRYPWDETYACPIHNPSDRAKKIGRSHWRGDRGIMERICEHGVGHPDPDQNLAEGEGIHGCDGCCT